MNRIDKSIQEAGEAVARVMEDRRSMGHCLTHGDYDGRELRCPQCARVMDRHTPGPWTAQNTAGHDRHGQSVVYAETGGRGTDVAIVYNGEADAQLIASAPTMLAKLRELYAYFDDIGDGAPDASANARRALRWAAEITEILEQAGVKL